MLLRRVREHVTVHNWFAVGVDLVIVVLGVFLGMQVTNWNEVRVAQASGQSYRARIVRDLDNNERDMQARTAYYLQVKDFSEQVLASLDGSARISDEQFLIAAYQATQIYPRPMIRYTYDEMLAVGALETLGDVPTREKIANYYVALETSEATFRNLPPYRDIVRRAIPYHAQQRIRENCTEGMETSPSGFVTLSLPEQCELGLSREALARAATRVRATPALELDLTRHLADIDQKLIQFGRSEERAHRLGGELSAPR